MMIIPRIAAVVLASVAFFAVMSPSSVVAIPTTQEEAQQATVLADRIRAEIERLGCVATKEQVLEAIYTATAGQDLLTIANALEILEPYGNYCPGAQQALAEAAAAAQLALNTTPAPGGVGGGGTPFGTGDVGAPGGGGGSGYPD